MKSYQGILLAATLGLTLVATAGCDDSQKSTTSPSNSLSTSTTAEASPQLSAREQLSAAVVKLNSTPSKITIVQTVGGVATTHGAGSADPAHQLAQMSMTVQVEGKELISESLTVGYRVYLRLNVPIPGVDPGKWMRIDMIRATLGRQLSVPDPEDPSGAKSFENSVVTVQKATERSYTGTLDLAKNKIAATTQGQALVEYLGPAAHSVPFEATVDENGHLSSMTITTPAIGSMPSTSTVTTFTDFGVPVSIQKPAATEIQDAPDQIYGLE